MFHRRSGELDTFGALLSAAAGAKRRRRPRGTGVIWVACQKTGLDVTFDPAIATRNGALEFISCTTRLCARLR